MKMISMKKDKKEGMDEPMMAGDQDYPYGLCLSLDEDSLEKLGLDKLPEVGSEMIIQAKVHVTSKSVYESKDDIRKTLSLQIIELGVGNKKASAEKVMYDKEPKAKYQSDLE